MKSPLGLLLAVVVLLTAGLLISRLMVSKPEPVRGYLDQIALSDDQKQRVEDIRKDFLPKVAHIREELRKARLQLNDLIFASNPDLKAIEDKTREIATLQTELEREVVNHILQEKAILTFEQKRQFYEIIKKEFQKGGLGLHGEQGRGNNVRRKGE